MKLIASILILSAIHLNGAVETEQSSKETACLMFRSPHDHQNEIRVDSLSYVNGYRFRSNESSQDSLSRKAFRSMGHPENKIVITVTEDQQESFQNYAKMNVGNKVEILFGHNTISEMTMFLPIKGKTYILFVKDTVDRDEIVPQLRFLLPEK